tara:strand:- start:2369 stop:2695 length:327 start_codon:yes stop_codon:yes gene_type:complete
MEIETKNNHSLEEQFAYDRAVKRVKELKSFYIHLAVFIAINLLIVYINISNLKPNESYFKIHNFYTFIFWGIGITAHALSVFLPRFILSKDWEKRKIESFLEKDRLNK